MIVITGPTGGIGSRVLSQLLPGGEALRVVVRDPQRLPAEVRDRVDVVEGSHGDPAVVERALDGARALFWLVASDPAASDPLQSYVGFSLPAAAALPGSGVQRVVTVSALGRQVQRWAGHASASRAMDDVLRSTGVHLRALLAPSLMDNLLRGAAALGTEGVLRDAVPEDLRAPLVARRDVADVAARLLADDAWTGQDDVPVLGPEDLSPAEVARTVGEVLDRPVRYERVPLEGLRQGLLAHGMSAGMAEGMVSMDAAKADGLDLVEDPERATRTPTTLRAWAQEVLLPAVRAAA